MFSVCLFIKTFFSFLFFAFLYIYFGGDKHACMQVSLCALVVMFLVLFFFLFLLILFLFFSSPSSLSSASFFLGCASEAYLVYVFQE